MGQPLTREASPPAVQPENAPPAVQPQQPVQQPAQQPQPQAAELSPRKRKRQLELQKWQLYEYNAEQKKKWKEARAAEKRQRTSQTGNQAAQPPLRQPPTAAQATGAAAAAAAIAAAAVPAGNVRTLADLQRAGPSRQPARPVAGGHIFSLGDLPPSGDACARCHSSDGQLYEAMGKVWHHECLLCDRCQQPTGRSLFQIPGWDEMVYCARCCNRRQDRCIACNRPCNGSWQLEEGRCICSDCAATAVWTTDEAQPEYARVQRFFSQQGLALPARAPPLELVDWSVLQQRARKNGRQLEDANNLPATHTLGLCVSVETSEMVNGQAVSRAIRCTGVLAMCGMPALLTGATIAHECTHAIMRMHGLPTFELDDFVEEGLAQLIALLYLEQRQAKGLGTAHEKRLCTAQAEGIRQNSSYIYGDGFRAAYAAYQRLRSLPELVQYVQRKHRFPG